MDTESLLWFLIDPRVSHCMFHSRDFVTMHYEDGSVKAARRERKGKWQLVVPKDAELEARYEARMVELGDKFRRHLSVVGTRRKPV